MPPPHYRDVKKIGMMTMPISKKKDGWYWGGQGPFESREKAEDVAQAAHASGYKKMDKAYGEPYKQIKQDRKQNKRTMQAMLKDGFGGAAASTGTTGDTTGEASYVTPTHGSNKKVKAFKDWIKKEEMTTFTSNDVSDEGYPDEANSKKSLKRSSGIERAGKFLDDFSPDVNKGRKKGKISHDMLLPAVPSVNTDTIPTHSHKTNNPMAKSLVMELIEFASTELQKAPMRATGASADPNYSMDTNPTQPWKRKVDDKAGMGEQDTVPVKTVVDENNVTNMGQAGGFENSRGMADVANDDGSGGKVTGSIPKKEHKKNKPTLVTLDTPFQSGQVMQAMEKGVGYISSATNPKQKTESATDYKHPQSTHTEHEGELNTFAAHKQKDMEERAKKYKRAEKEGEESNLEPPLQAAGATAAAMSNPVTQLMMKQEWRAVYDSLHRGGDHDKISERDDEELDEEVENMIKEVIVKNYMRR